MTKETKRAILAEISTTDFSHENMHKLLCEKFGELFIKVDEIEDAIKKGFIEIGEDGFIFYGDC